MRASKKCVWMATLGVLSVCAFGISGCKDKQKASEQQTLQAEAVRLEVENQVAEILDLQEKGHTEDAMALLDTCLADKKYNAHWPRFFAQKVDLLLTQDKCEDARVLVLKTLAKQPQLAQSACTRISLYYQNRRDHAAMLDWCKELLLMGKGKTLSQDLRQQILEWQLSATAALGDPVAIGNIVTQILTELRPEQATPLLQQVINTLLASGRIEQISAMLACLESNKKGTAKEYKDLIAATNLRSLLVQKDWLNVPDAVEACAKQLNDESLLALLRQAFATLQKNQQTALLEEVGQSVFLTVPSKGKSAGYVARIWMEIGMLADKRVFPERLIALLEAKVPAEQIANLFEYYFYEFVEDHETIKSLCVIGERIVEACTEKDTQNALKIRLLDGAFIVEDYDLALTMLERGIPDKPKEWHNITIPKVKAHRALIQDKKEDAIGYFREFMRVMTELGQDEEHDPSTGVAYSKEWLLGRNAHRIATLYDSLSDTTNAAKAREEAKALFDRALEKASKDASTLKILKEELAEMGIAD